MAKSDKLYSKSPSIKKDADGKAGISKPSEADAEDMGIGGDDAEGNQTQMPVDVQQVGDTQKRHMTEMKDMHKRHEDESKDMHKRHTKEIGKSFGDKDKEDK